MFDVFFTSIIPLLVFCITNCYKNLKTSVILSIISSFIILGVTKMILGFFTIESIMMVLLLITFGVLATIKNNSLYIKIQPVILSTILILIVFYQYLADPNFAAKVLHTAGLFQDSNLINEANLLSYSNLIDKMLIHCLLWLTIHTGLLLWTAFRFSTRIWMITKIMLFPFFALMTVLGEIFLLSIQ